MRALPSFSVAKPLLLPNPRAIMSSTSFSSSAHTAASGRRAAILAVPGLTVGEISAAAGDAFARHSSVGLKRPGSGVAIVWFRNDLRVLDNEALLQAWAASAAVLPVYCIDPRHFATTHYFGFHKTGGFL